MKRMLIAAGCALSLVGMTAAPAMAEGTAAVACTVASPQAQRLDATVDPSGTARYEQWLQADSGQRFNQDVQRRAELVFGSLTGKRSLLTLLRAGLIGHAFDHRTHTVVTVVTPEFAGRDGLRTKLGTVTGPAGLHASVITGCFSAARLIAAHDLIMARTWHPDAAQAAFTVRLDPATSRLQVVFDARYPQAGAALSSKLGDVLALSYGTGQRAGRLDDGEPHFGGSGIRKGSGSSGTNTCTSGFVARRNVDGVQGAFTAGHCFANGVSVYSGPQFYGSSWGKADYPTYDMIGLKSGTERYDNVIHVDPCCPTARNVTGRYSPAIGEKICASGMVTRAICGLTVSGLNATFCDADGCTPGLLEFHKGGVTVVRGGDSGGPLYTQSGTSNAKAVGMIIAYNEGGAVGLAEHLSNIEDHLNLAVRIS